MQVYQTGMVMAIACGLVTALHHLDEPGLGGMYGGATVVLGGLFHTLVTGSDVWRKALHGLPLMRAAELRLFGVVHHFALLITVGTIGVLVGNKMASGSWLGPAMDVGSGRPRRTSYLDAVTGMETYGEASLWADDW
ncbi:uncharacterized protein AMSG_01740 [Thecamonas trahens ATCC 50062]|uniref:Uncharacterized protein n=1 Tax=Thecamonas trahens ATCC 50062 TaxID=461836 RepID=A0A0L0DTV0_THETB|nr:hypothetical protein AMSG_01740 [Thecamonas trahens ATCC 50062]KNC55476.1 hypothetical protein AMSG_01740 [Thecamonas trahens ATCC 50062]|eukprot:XP_013761256.1 hypothetical protein AMSG_01740 [Thecamonas trahens ATCC 50062]